jgi:hypothetical protein
MRCNTGMAQPAILEATPAQLGTLDLGGMWVQYLNLADEEFLPTRLKIGQDEYAYTESIIISGHSATLPPRVRELRASGKKVAIVEHRDRYVTFVSPP